MGRTVHKNSLVVEDIWKAYVIKMLKENPSLKTRFSRQYQCSNFSVGFIRSDGRFIELMNYKRFRNIIEHYFDRAKREIIKGNCINLTARVGKICAKRVERDFRKDKQLRIDWAKTRLQPKITDPVTGKISYRKHIYFITDDWCRIAWVKNRALKNETVYEFKPSARNSAGTSGFKYEFSVAQKEDPLLKYQYLFTPLIRKQ